jgi:hypothetical protein
MIRWTRIAKKWLLVFLAACLMVAPAMAEDKPYIAIVGNDITANPFYPKYQQFLRNQDIPGYGPVCYGTFPPVIPTTRVGGAGCEQFRSQTVNNQPEVCDPTSTGGGLENARVAANNVGWYEWWIRLPQKPLGEINIVLQCGVVFPNALAIWQAETVEHCAAETGERSGLQCVRLKTGHGVNPVVLTALPKITAIAYPGPPYNSFTNFHLTAFKNPSSYKLSFNAGSRAMSNSTNSQVLDGGTGTRILLKACMDETIVTKLPVTGQINALAETETDLEAGDLIYVRMDVPQANTVDIYCHAQSVRLTGIGEIPL